MKESEHENNDNWAGMALAAVHPQIYHYLNAWAAVSHHNGLPLGKAWGVRGSAGLIQHGILHVDQLRPTLPRLELACILQRSHHIR